MSQVRIEPRASRGLQDRQSCETVRRAWHKIEADANLPQGRRAGEIANGEYVGAQTYSIAAS
ncbi:MAG TPA: hypothetical protein VFG05_01710 [Methylocella sp.]|nr:hypothetical protein [Methylocella sp.]